MGSNGKYQAEIETLAFSLLVKQSGKPRDEYITAIMKEFPNSFAAYTERHLSRTIVAQPLAFSPEKIDTLTPDGEGYEIKVDLHLNKGDFDAVRASDRIGRGDLRATYQWLEEASQKSSSEVLDKGLPKGESNIVAFAYLEDWLEKTIKERTEKESSE